MKILSATVICVLGISMILSVASAKDKSAVEDRSAKPESVGETEAEAEGVGVGNTNRLEHCAIGAKIHVTSTHEEEEGEGSAEMLIDGDPVTRWSSDYSEPQEIVITFDKPKRLEKVCLHWENASAIRYRVLVSPDSKKWEVAHLYFNTDQEMKPRVDEIVMPDDPVIAINLELLGRVNEEWGFSLYEIEAIEERDD
jgi:hypothetical protein